MSPIVKVAVLYFGVLATLLAVFAGLFLAILGGASGWLLAPMIATGIAALRIGDWWLPTLTCRYMNKDQP